MLQIHVLLKNKIMADLCLGWKRIVSPELLAFHFQFAYPFHCTHLLALKLAEIVFFTALLLFIFYINAIYYILS